MDYLVLGSNGFAQIGNSAFYEKMKIEMDILIEYFCDNFPIPKQFRDLAWYSVKTFHHDFGDYKEIVLWYDRDYINLLEESEDEAQQAKHDLFWTWFRVIESVDLESEELTDQIKEAYFKSVDVSKGQHLSVSIAS